MYPDVIPTPERRHTMTYEDYYSIPEELLEHICEQGFGALPELIRIILNTAMKIEHHNAKYMKAGVASDIRAVFNAPDGQEADTLAL